VSESDQIVLLQRIADALDRVAPPPSQHDDLLAHAAYSWDGGSLSGISDFKPTTLDLLTGIEDQKQKLLDNSQRHARGYSAHDILLWGSRGMGKSASVKAVIYALQKAETDIAIVEAAADHLDSLPALFAVLGTVKRPFILFIDDIGFEDNCSAPRLLRSILEGGAAERPSNVRLYATSNRRHIVARNMAEQDDPINPRDVVDDKLALSDRFGLRLGFHAASQDDYLAMIAKYAATYDLIVDQDDALLWSKQRGSRSGRVAWQYIVELAGRDGKTL